MSGGVDPAKNIFILYGLEQMTVEHKTAAGMILISEGNPPELLLLKHTDRWDLPKGHVDGDEDLLETAYRETWEETGISTERIRLDRSFHLQLEYIVKSPRWGEYLKTVTYFLGVVDSSEPIVLSEHVGFEWISLPVRISIQEQTIDPVLKRVQQHLALD
jgi:bis(5'-nucleosidyl)-tetraphosphatase